MGSEDNQRPGASRQKVIRVRWQRRGLPVSVCCVGRPLMASPSRRKCSKEVRSRSVACRRGSVESKCQSCVGLAFLLGHSRCVIYITIFVPRSAGTLSAPGNLYMRGKLLSIKFFVGASFVPSSTFGAPHAHRYERRAAPFGPARSLWGRLSHVPRPANTPQDGHF